MTDTTTADKPEALRLADALQNAPLWESQAPLIAGFRADDDTTLEEAAAELRRLHALAAQEAKPEHLQIAPVNNEAGSTMSIVRWQIETPAGLVGAYRREALEYLLAARVQEAEPAAWLVHGGKTFRDKPFMDKAQAERSVAERKDGAMVSPLHLHAARAKEGKA